MKKISKKQTNSKSVLKSASELTTVQRENQAKGIYNLLEAMYPVVITTDGRLVAGKDSILENWDCLPLQTKKDLMNIGYVQPEKNSDTTEEQLVVEGTQLIFQAAEGLSKANRMIQNTSGRARFSLLQKNQVIRSFRKLARGYNAIIKIKSGKDISSYGPIRGICMCNIALANLARTLTLFPNGHEEFRNLVLSIDEYQEASRHPKIIPLRNQGATMIPESCKLLLERFNDW